MRIIKIVVDELFGYYDYELESNANNPQLLILYGDNGSGKTTILKMVYYLLSYVDGRGHKTKLTKIKFKKFKIVFDNLFYVEALRGSCDDTDYVINVCEGGEVDSYCMTTNNTGSVTAECEDADKVIRRLQMVDIDTVFLSDRREYISYEVEKGEFDSKQDFMKRNGKIYYRDSERRKEIDSFDVKVLKAVQRAEKWIQKTVLYSSGVGQINSNSVYLNVAKALCGIGRKSVDKPLDKQDLIDQLDRVESLSIEYAEYGMASSDIYNELGSVVEAAKDEQLADLVTILKPFLDGTEARLNELSATYDVVKSFSEYLREFFSRKEVTFDVVDGLSVRIKGNPLDIETLSSGEKQLLAILCNVLSARESNSIFIIDEPEISLNVKWQRILLKSLMECSDKYKTQLIVATHSIEMISQHLDNVLKLEDKSCQKN